MRYLAVLLVLSLAPGCDSAEEPAPPGINGAWTGEVVFEGETATINLDLVQERTVVTGTGELVAPQATVPFSVADGSYIPPAVSLSLQFADRPPGSLNGFAGEEAGRMDVQVSGPNLSGTDVELVRR